MKSNAEIMEKINCLKVLKEKGSKEALRIFPDLSSFIENSKTKDVDQLRESLKEQLK